MSVVVVDSSLRSINLYVSDYHEYYLTAYDSANHVARTEQSEVDVIHANGGSWVKGDQFTYGAHGNVVQHTREGFSGMEYTTYYNGIDV